MAILSEAQLRNAAGLEGPEKLGLGTNSQNFLRRKEAEKRSEDYQGFRDFLKKIPQLPGRAVTGFVDKNLQGLGFLTDVFGRTEGSETIAGLRDQLYDPSKNTFISAGDKLNTKVGNLDPNKVSLRDQPKPGDQDFKRPDSIFAEEGPLGSITDDVMAKINARDDFDAKRNLERNLIDEEANLKSFPATGGQIGEAQTDDESIEALGSDPTEDLFSSAMQDYITGARGAGPETPEKKTIEDYKKDFAEATGIDVSGKVDKSSALMAMGLALMQNKAGKGFNVGKILSEVGKAGEKALPKLEAAKKVARQGALAGGKYALNKQTADETLRRSAKEKTMDRGKYWVYEKGEPGSEFANFDKGSFVDLNKYEINDLVNNPDFEKQFEFIKGSDRLDILKTRAEGIDLGDEWTDYKMVSLIGGDPDDVPPELQIMAAAVDPNYEGKTSTGFKIQETDETIIRRFAEYQKSITSGSKKFEVLLENLNEGISIPKQILGGMQQALRNFGIDAGSMPDNVREAKRVLNNLAIDEATNILKESGKTLSDNDRKLVAKRIGEISWTSGDVELIRRQLKEIYDLTVLKPQRNLDRSIDWLDKNAGIKIWRSSR